MVRWPYDDLEVKNLNFFVFLNFLEISLLWHRWVKFFFFFLSILLKDFVIIYVAPWMQMPSRGEPNKSTPTLSSDHQSSFIPTDQSEIIAGRIWDHYDRNKRHSGVHGGGDRVIMKDRDRPRYPIWLNCDHCKRWGALINWSWWLWSLQWDNPHITYIQDLWLWPDSSTQESPEIKVQMDDYLEIGE